MPNVQHADLSSVAHRHVDASGDRDSVSDCKVIHGTGDRLPIRSLDENGVISGDLY
jgi:hypothetical protein